MSSAPPAAAVLLAELVGRSTIQLLPAQALGERAREVQGPLGPCSVAHARPAASGGSPGAKVRSPWSSATRVETEVPILVPDVFHA